MLLHLSSCRKLEPKSKWPDVISCFVSFAPHEWIVNRFIFCLLVEEVHGESPACSQCNSISHCDVPPASQPTNLSHCHLSCNNCLWCRAWKQLTQWFTLSFSPSCLCGLAVSPSQNSTSKCFCVHIEKRDGHITMNTCLTDCVGDCKCSLRLLCLRIVTTVTPLSS